MTVEYFGKERESQLSYLEGKLTLGQRREEFPEPLVGFPILPYMRFSFIGTQNTKASKELHKAPGGYVSASSGNPVS